MKTLIQTLNLTFKTKTLIQTLNPNLKMKALIQTLKTKTLIPTPKKKFFNPKLKPKPLKLEP
jgi:hypothetical protein